jgi:serine protease Do
MKHVIMKRMLIAGIALLTVPSVFAQKEKEKDKIKDDKEKTEKKVQTIVITRNGDLNEKTTIEIDGDKVKVNGKDAKDDKDVSVHVNTHTSGVYRMNGRGDNFVWNDGNNTANGFSLFSEDENRAMLGVTTEGNDKGAEVMSITKESAAEKAGLKKGDIITKIDDRKIESTDDVTDAIRNHKPGDKVSITYLRDGKEQKATSELTKWKGVRMNALTVPQMQGFDRQMDGLNQQWKEMVPGTDSYSFAFGGRPRLGLSVQDTDDGDGVKVLDVDEESAAAKAGIKKDDIILGIDDADVKGTDDVLRATRATKDKTSYKFKVKRGGSTQTIEVKIPRKLKTADI